MAKKIENTSISNKTIEALNTVLSTHTIEKENHLKYKGATKNEKVDNTIHSNH